MAAKLFIRLTLLLSVCARIHSYSCDNARQNFIAAINCGEGQCACANNSAHCIGNESLFQIPPLWENITDIYVECYYFYKLGKKVFAKIDNLNLTGIRLNYVKIKHISNDTFQDFANLQTLDLSNNPGINTEELSKALGSIQKQVPVELYLNYVGVMSDFTFDLLHKSNVVKLSMSGNYLTTLNTTDFNGFTNLSNLYLRNNWINTIEGGTQLPALKILDLRWNRLQVQKKINFCNNKTSSFLPNLTHLLINNNYISSLQTESIECLKKLAILDLSNNTMKHVNMSTFSELTSLNTLNLSFNWLQNVTSGLLPQALYSIDFRNNEFVQFPPKLCVNNTLQFPSVKYINIARNYIRTSKYFANWSCLTGLEALDIEANDISLFTNNSFSVFPKLRNLSLARMVSSINHIEQLAFSSSSLTHLNLSHNLIKLHASMKAVFEACPNIGVLDLSHNFLNNSILAHVLSPLQAISSLYLQHADLSRFPIEVLLKLPNLTLLNLDKNCLEYWNFPSNFSGTLNLHELSLRGNFIRILNKSYFPKQLEYSLRILDLQNNPFDCTCDIRWFRKWMDSTRVMLVNKDSYKCKTPMQFYGTLLVNFDAVKACESPNPWIIIYTTIGSFLFVFLVVCIIVYKYKWYLQYYCFKLKKNWHQRQDGFERDPLLNREEIIYDGYVIYNDADGPFVHDDLRKLLENTNHYRLHIWERNATNGSRIDVIFDAVKASRCFVAVISNHSIKDPWFQFQMNVCFEMSVEHQRNSLILVVLEDVDFQALNKSWCVLLTKTPTAHWCGLTTDIKHSLFINQIQQHFRLPIAHAQNDYQAVMA